MSDPPVVGVIGAGQLARMMYQAAISLGIDVRVLASHPGDAAARIARHVTVGDWHDPGELRAFAAGCDVVTFDHELVDAPTVRLLEDAGTAVHPGSACLAVAADKGRQRSLCGTLGIPVPPHALTTTAHEATEAARRFGYPVVAKATRGGYDGRGVWWLRSEAEVRALFDGLPPGATILIEPSLALAEELATQVVRRADGAMVHYPLVRTFQVDGICRSLEAPADVPEHLRLQAHTWAGRIADAVGAVGVLAVEFFVVDGRLLVNELAPRPHNSGHYTIDACVTSQFENHLRAVLGLPLGSGDLTVDAAAMANLIGTDLDVAELRGLIADPHTRLHAYAKDERPGRKVGHVTRCGHDPTELRRHVEALADATGVRSPA